MQALAAQTSCGSSRRVWAIAQAMRCACAGEASDAAAQLQQAATATRAWSAEEAALRDRLLAADRRRQPQAMADFAEPPRLRPAELEQFRRAGFLLREGFVGDASVRALCQTLDAVTEGTRPLPRSPCTRGGASRWSPAGQAAHSGSVRRVYEPCARYASYRAFAESPLLLGAVAQLLGSDDLMCHYSKVNMKPPQVDTIVDWQCATLYPPASTPCPPMRHCTLTPCVRMRRCPPCSQDLSYYPLTNKSSVAVLLYLDDADEQNGALRVVPRDWNAPDVLLDHNSDAGASLYEPCPLPCHVASTNDDAFWYWRCCNTGSFQGRIPTLGTPDGADSPSNQIVLGAPAGSAICLGGLTPHASAPNRSARHQRTLIVSYRTADSFPLYLGDRHGRYTTEKHVRLVSGQKSLGARMEAGTLAVPRYRHDAESIFEIQVRSRRGDA